MAYYAPTRLSDNIHQTPEGFLVCLGVPIARTGWQTYLKEEVPIEPGDGPNVEIYRDAKDVFDLKTIASFEGKPFTVGHPGIVTPETWKQFAKGNLQNIRKSKEKDQDGNEALLADVLVTDAEAISLVKLGLREVSCGYDAVFEQISPGKGKQTNIIGNHLALVSAGRAGPSYAIQDSKEGMTRMSKLKEKVKGIFSKAVEDAADEAAAEMGDDLGKEVKKADGSIAFDELVKMVKDMSDKLGGYLAAKDKASADKAPMDEEKKEEKEEKKEEAKDSDQVEMSIEERLKKVEAALESLMEKESVGDEDKDDKKDDKKEDKKEEAKDAKAEGVVGDEDTTLKSRAEILSPGIQMSKDVMVRALESAYSTDEGKQAIHALTGGKAPTFDSAEKVSHLFIATSEILRAKRGTGLEKSKSIPQVTLDALRPASQGITPEEMNKINEQFYSQAK